MLGSYNECTSWGGLVAGYNNEIAAPFATVSGGQQHSRGRSELGKRWHQQHGAWTLRQREWGMGEPCQGGAASLSGGSHGYAEGTYSSITGVDNTAWGPWASKRRSKTAYGLKGPTRRSASALHSASDGGGGVSHA